MVFITSRYCGDCLLHDSSSYIILIAFDKNTGMDTDWQRERERDRERETDRQTEGERERQTDRQRERETDRQRERTGQMEGRKKR